MSLGEGGTPLQPTQVFGENWLIKDESVNPTASFKARGMAMAVSMAKQFGIQRLAVPSAGNAGGALAAYGAAAGMEVLVAMPDDTPAACVEEARQHGAIVELKPKLIHELSRELAERADSEGWFLMNTLREPYRVEGKKTMGYEIAEQLGWTLPDAILYPTGGGTGLIGMWKAFDEMERMGWIDSRRPRMYAVQAEGCPTIYNAWKAGERFAEPIQGARTSASGLRVPAALGDFIILDALKESGGKAVAVSDSEMRDCALEIARKTGINAAPEGGACLAAARRLFAQGDISPGEQVVLFNTGSGAKYREALGL